MLRVGLIAIPALVSAAHGQTTATYIGPNNGFWNEPANWDIGVVPVNDDDDTFNVIVPVGITVDFDILTPAHITGLNLQSGSRINFTNTDLDVLGVALLDNTYVVADGASARFATHAPFVGGMNQRAAATAGGVVRLELSSYTQSRGTAYRMNTTWLSARGAGSLVDLSSVTLVDATNTSGHSASYWYQVLAGDGGTVDFSNVATIRGTRPSENDWLRFRAEPGGTIDLSAVTDVLAGDTWFDFAGGVLDLSSIATVSGGSTRFSLADGVTTFPVLATVDSSAHIDVPAGGTLNLPSITAVRNSVFDIRPGGAVNAPLLTDFRNSSLLLTPDTAWNAPRFRRIENARLHAIDGAELAVADTEYVQSRGTAYGTNTTWLSAQGHGSLLDMSSVTVVDATNTSGHSATYWYQVLAKDGGLIDLSNVTSIKGTRSSENDWLRFRAESGGVIDLSAVETITGGDAWFDLAGGTLRLDSVSAVDGTTRFDVPIFEVLNLPSVTSIANSSFNIQDGGTVNAPLLTDFRNSSVTLTPTRFWNVPPLQVIDHARIHITQGATLLVADADYVQAFGTAYTTNTTWLSVQDAGSLLDLSNLVLIDATGTSGHSGSWVYQLLASNGGSLDLSGVTTIRGSRGSDDDWLRIRAETGGLVLFGNVAHDSGDLWINIVDANSAAIVSGDLLLVDGAAARLTVAQGELRVGGDLLHDIRSESLHSTSLGTLVMNGASLQHLEVAGSDLGLPQDVINDNFNWGVLKIGEDTQATTVVLKDVIDNGNRGAGGEPELLYLSGFPQGDSGLRIRGGSILYLNGLEVYAAIGNQWTRIRDLFPGGVTRIAFDDGFIDLGAPCPADMNGDGQLDATDFFQFLDLFAAGDLAADLNGDGVLDANDFFAFLDYFVAGCGG